MTDDQIIQHLLHSRGLTSAGLQQDFFSPPSPHALPSPFNSTPAIDLIKHHLSLGHKIGLYGDYDVDGICATAILWETLHLYTPDIIPFIPHRRLHGYGLSRAGLDELLSQGVKLIISLDSGIVAHEAIGYARSQGCDIIVIDHHEPAETLPEASVILHSTTTSAAALAWFFARDFVADHHEPLLTDLLSLAALAVVCDLVPLLGTNRSFATHGLVALNRTRRPGLLALLNLAGISLSSTPLTTYHAGFIIGPRINAMGRLDHALDSLRLLCTTDPSRASDLARTLTDTNKLRQDLTESAVTSAMSQLSDPLPSVIALADANFDEGVIGLVAAKLVEKFHHPAVVFSIGPTQIKGSARSVSGFHITDYLRQFASLLTSVGGHSQAAGLSLHPANLSSLLTSISTTQLDPQLLTKPHFFDLEIPLSSVSSSLLEKIKKFEPFGLGNPTPVFKSLQIEVTNFRSLGASGQHLKFLADRLEAIWFNHHLEQVQPSTSLADLIYQISENTWNGRTTLQLHIRTLLPPAV